MKTEITGNIPNLITAYYAVLSIPDKNFNMNIGFGSPFTIDARGRCRLSAPPVSWAIQHPDIKAQGIKLQLVNGSKDIYAPVMDIKPLHMKNKSLTLRGTQAVARVFGVSSDIVHKMFSPWAYSGKVTSADVAKRIKSVINRVGGRETLATKEKALTAHKRATEKTQSEGVKAKKGGEKSKK